MRVMHLQQRLHDLIERERLAKEHNRQLMQQFEEAQDTLREMLERTAAMKLLRNEYQRYYQSTIHLDYQIKPKTQTGQEYRIGGSFNTQKKSLEDQETSNAQLLPLHGLGNMPKKTRTYQESDSPLELQTHTQPHTTAFPKGPSNQPWDNSKSSPLSQHTNLSHSLSLPFTLGQQLPYTANSYISGPNGQLYMDQVLPLSAQEKEAMPRRPPSSKSNTSENSNSHLQELDVKPVRLSNGQAESNSSSRRASSQKSEKRKRRMRKSNRSGSSDGDRHRSQESSQSSALPSALKAKNSAGEDSEKSISQISKKSSQLDLKRTKNESENSLADHNKGNETDVEESESNEGSQSPEEEQPGRTRLKNTKLQETEHSILDQGGQEDAEGDVGKGQSDAEGKETSQDEEEDHLHQEDIPQCTSSEEDTNSETDEAEDQAEVNHEVVESGSSEDEDEDKIEEVIESKKDHVHQEDIPQCTSSEQEADIETDEAEDLDELNQQDVAESESSDAEEDGDKLEDVRESKQEEDESKNTAQRTQDSDSEDGIIAPQTRSKIIYVIPEHPDEQDEEEEESDSKTSLDDDQTSNHESEDDDIENQLAPQQQRQKLKEEPKAEDKPKGVYVIRVKQQGQTEHHTDSDEFDDFFD